MEQAVQLFVVTDGELEVAGIDSVFLVVAGGVACQLEDLGCEVLHDGCQVDRSAGTDTLGVVAGAKKTVDSTDGELQTSACRAALGLGASLASLSTSRHGEYFSPRVFAAFEKRCETK